MPRTTHAVIRMQPAPALSQLLRRLSHRLLLADDVPHFEAPGARVG
jgi:hypothetical protein